MDRIRNPVKIRNFVLMEKFLINAGPPWFLETPNNTSIGEIDFFNGHGIQFLCHNDDLKNILATIDCLK